MLGMGVALFYCGTPWVFHMIILFVTSWDYGVGKISGNNYLSDVTMVFDVILHALQRTKTVDFYPERLI